MALATNRGKKRAYRMGARAEAAEQTGRAIQTAATELFRALPFEQVTLDEVAERAGVTLQTVLRRFGSKQGLFETTARELAVAASASRVPERPNDVGLALRTLLASYDEIGDLGWRALCQEEQFDFLREALVDARARHRAWVETSFACALEGVCEEERERRMLLLFSATDYYVYKLLHRDLGRSRAETLRLMTDLVSGVLASFERPGDKTKAKAKR